MSGSWPCITCSVREQGFCRAFEGERRADPEQWQKAVKQTFFTVRAKREIFSQSERASNLYVLCQGWSIRWLRLPEGARQIISVALPGDLLSFEALFREAHLLSAEALTDVQISRFDGENLRQVAIGDSAFVDVLFQTLLEEDKRTYDLLGRINSRSAKQRIASIILDITNRVNQRSIVRGERYHFPIRQKHLADLLGMTSIHVSRVMGELKREKIVMLDRSYLEVLDRVHLEKIARRRA